MKSASKISWSCESPRHAMLSEASGTEPAATFDAVIWPNASMSEALFRIFVSAVVVIAALGVTAASMQGLWPISVIGIAEAGALVTAVALTRRMGQRVEHVQILRGSVVVEHVGAYGETDTKCLPLLNLKLERHDDPDFGCRALFLRGAGRRVEVARDLSPGEREEFARAFSDAIERGGGTVDVHRHTSLPLDPSGLVSTRQATPWERSC